MIIRRKGTHLVPFVLDRTSCSSSLTFDITHNKALMIAYMPNINAKITRGILASLQFFVPINLQNTISKLCSSFRSPAGPYEAGLGLLMLCLVAIFFRKISPVTTFMAAIYGNLKKRKDETVQGWIGVPLLYRVIICESNQIRHLPFNRGRVKSCRSTSGKAEVLH
jgi:hypothetical protein